MFLLALLLLAFPTLAQDSLSVGDSVTGTITDEMPAVRYNIDLEEDQVIGIRMASTADVTAIDRLDSYLQILNPEGMEMQNDDDSAGFLNAYLGPFRAPVSGTYTIVATRCCGPNGAGQSTGEYTLTVSETQLPFLNLNEPAEVELTPEQPVQAFYFDAQAAETYFVRSIVERVSGEGNFFAQGRGPIGREYFGQSTQPIPQRIIVEPVPMDIDNGAYYFSANLFPPAPPMDAPNTVMELQPVTVRFTVEGIDAATIDLGNQVTGTLNDENPQDYYTFDASAGDLLRLDGNTLETSMGDFEIIIYGPNGLSMAGNNTAYQPEDVIGFTSDPITVDRDGPHLAILRRLNATAPEVAGMVSDYAFTVAPSAVPTLELGTPVSDVVGGGQQGEIVYRLQGTAGQTVTFTLTSESESYGPGIDVEEPLIVENAPRVLFSLYSVRPGSLQYTVTLPSDGTYLVRVFNNNFQQGPVAGDFTLTVSEG